MVLSATFLGPHSTPLPPTVAHPGQACRQQAGPEVCKGICDKVALAGGGSLGATVIWVHLTGPPDILKFVCLLLPHLQASTNNGFVFSTALAMQMLSLGLQAFEAQWSESSCPIVKFMCLLTPHLQQGNKTAKLSGTLLSNTLYQCTLAPFSTNGGKL